MNEVQMALRRYALAHKLAEENPRLLLDAKTAAECTRVSKLCSQRMDECHAADDALMVFVDHPLATPALKAFAAADSDKGCSSCWLSSKSNKDHPDCECKIYRWFECREALVTEGFANNY